MKTGPEGIKLIKEWERLELESYQDDAGVWTIGYGDTGPHVVEGQTITEAEAERRLVTRLSREFEPAVRSALTREATQKQFDAMVSLAYNIGGPSFKSSTLVKVFNAGDDVGAGLQFTRWDKVRVKGVLVSSLGLQRRRYSELLLFYGEDVDEAIKQGRAYK